MVRWWQSAKDGAPGHPPFYKDLALMSARTPFVHQLHERLVHISVMPFHYGYGEAPSQATSPNYDPSATYRGNLVVRPLASAAASLLLPLQLESFVLF